MILELLKDGIEHNDHDGHRNPPVRKTEENRRHRGECGSENGNNLKNGGEDGEQERMFDAENGKSEVDEHPHDDREDELPLHPETDFGLRTAPEVEHIFLILFG